MQPDDLNRYFLALYLLVNIISFVLFANDKRKARNKNWRTRESVLLTSAFFGPFGAYAAMKIFRHKTQKNKFYLVPFFLLMHTGLFFLFIAGYV